ncbi:hypothetical protein R5R35_005152 [Gryllus longicercus]|uniref:Uncharacterized protein n=1 Tax=Gryllus longicercus TaxID=2509291 RepID=A0AAN9V5W1_9ORTH
MTTTRRGHVFGTFLTSCAALVLLIVSCATNVWITSEIDYPPLPLQRSNANYGLFRGTFDKVITSTNKINLDIRLVCDFGENICAWSCQKTSEYRKQELADLLNNIPRECALESFIGLSAGTNGTRFAGSNTRAISKGCLDLLCLILWGANYATVLKDNIALNEVISGIRISKDFAQLGWSYW